jgi:RecJ-like exonuclease
MKKIMQDCGACSGQGTIPKMVRSTFLLNGKRTEVTEQVDVPCKACRGKGQVPGGVR